MADVYKRQLGDSLRSALDDLLGLLQAQAGDLADNLDYVDLGGASLNQNNVEIGLGLGSRSAVSRAAANAGNSNRRSGNAKFFFQSLYQLRELHNLELFYSFHNLSNSHGIKPPFFQIF